MPKVNTKLWVKRYKTFMAMTEVIKNLKNTYGYGVWLPRFMTYDTWEASAEYIACHDDIYQQACDTFINLITIYGKDGIV